MRVRALGMYYVFIKIEVQMSVCVCVCVCMCACQGESCWKSTIVSQTSVAKFNRREILTSSEVM